MEKDWNFFAYEDDELNLRRHSSYKAFKFSVYLAEIDQFFSYIMFILEVWLNLCELYLIAYAKFGCLEYDVSNEIKFYLGLSFQLTPRLYAYSA